MANNTIAVLRQMLASLDDAKKYQSLRDVMSTMNAPDLAAVFEDLPEEKCRCCSVCALRTWRPMCLRSLAPKRRKR